MYFVLPNKKERKQKRCFLIMNRGRNYSIINMDIDFRSVSIANPVEYD